MSIESIKGARAAAGALAQGGVARPVADEEFDPAERLFDLFAEHRARYLYAQEALADTLTRRVIFFGRQLIPTFLRPYFVPRDVMDRVVIPTTESLLGLVETLAAEALRDRALYRKLGLREDALDLLEIEPGYERVVVISRPDAVMSRDGRLKFFEINSDSPAMMTFSDLLYEVLSEGFPLAELVREGYQLSYDAMTPKLLASLLDCWKEWGGTGTPKVAMTDWHDVRTYHEQRRITERFNEAGVETVFIDPRELRYREGRLYAGKMVVNLVYRRVLAEEVFDSRRELADLIAAYRDGKVCMVNPLRSYVAATKSMLPLVFDALRAGGHGPELAQCLPLTESATAAHAPRLLAEQSRFVLKKGVSHGGAGVVIGAKAGREAWERAVAGVAHAPWIVQEFVDLPRIDVPVASPDGAVRSSKFVNWNPFIFGGRVAGSIARVSDEPLINICAGGGLLPTVCYRRAP